MESVAEQRNAGVDARIVTLMDAYTESDAVQYGLPYVAVPASSPIAYSARLMPTVLAGSKPQVIHSHGMWLHPDYIALRLSEVLKVPLIVSPHGMLEPWALSNNWWKKAPIWWLWERRRLARADVIIATSELEAQHIRDLGMCRAIAVIPLGVKLPPVVDTGNGSDEKLGLFLSRIHPKKGLPLLVEAVRRIRPLGWKFIIAGPDSNGHEEEIRALVNNAGMQDTFEFRGPVYGEAKWRLLQSADLFILPSHSENFGLVVVESLASQTPVITTTTTPWQSIEKTGCGWYVDPTPEAITKALKEATLLPKSTLLEMGARGRALVEARFSWDQSVDSLISVHSWLLGQASRPACVVFP
jgi:glycosyltransferase involved in cell wall biosynthesis